MTRGPGSSSRLGLNVPTEWWPAAPLLKEIEAGGFGWVQIPAPPAAVLTDSRSCIRHAGGVGRGLAATSLRSVLHAPGDALAGTPEGDRVLEGALSYAAECGAEQVIYHARGMPDGRGLGARLVAETRSLAALTAVAERLDLTIAIENLAPVYPGPETISSTPQTLRALCLRIGSPALRICLDLGHANIVAALRHTSIRALTDPVLELVSVFHAHDNLGARWEDRNPAPELDPVRLDLHLPPGRGSVPWPELTGILAAHAAPIVLEVHPPHRRPATDLLAGARETILGEAPPAAVDAVA